ncbi:MAG TPA: c-type cytochrome [Bryobacteraceae bacterium]|nr:c-type cytochrome [Bryobacteraceae bacterium]
MRTVAFASLLALSPIVNAENVPYAADSKHGAVVFAEQQCVSCHASFGGANSPMDLSRRLDRSYTPAALTSLMWNHAPVMWSVMARQGIAVPKLSESDAADLFAYFYASHFFEKPGEAERGKALFTAKHCASCHALSAGGSSVGPPVAEWKALTDPTTLIARMFDHASQMSKAMERRNIPWPELTAQDMTDLLVYLQNLPQTRTQTLQFEMPAPQGGAALLREKGCENCHTDQRALERLVGDSTLTDVAAAMWNHAPLMVKSPATAPAQVSDAEMRTILSYIWARQFFSPNGDAARGQKVFESQKCGSCHNNQSSGAPALTRAGTPFSTVRMVSILWAHGPAMLAKMKDRNISWPRLSPNDMSNLIAYLNTRQ